MAMSRRGRGNLQKGLAARKYRKTFIFIKKNLQVKKKSVPLQSDSKKLFETWIRTTD